MTTTIVLALIVGAALYFALRTPAEQPDDSHDPGVYTWGDDEPEEELASAPPSLYQEGDWVLLQYNWWNWKGVVDDRPGWAQLDDGYCREVREERRAEVLAQVARNPWSTDSLFLVFADGNLTVPLSACDGSNRITYYQPPDRAWLIRSKWAREWL